MATPLGLVHPIKGDGEPCKKEKYPLQVPAISLFIIKFAGYNKCPLQRIAREWQEVYEAKP